MTGGILLDFPIKEPPESGLTYIVPDAYIGGWLLYRQPAGATEPELISTFEDFGCALAAGHAQARRRQDRFVVDWGVPR